jgi:hypothetical protein
MVSSPARLRRAGLRVAGHQHPVQALAAVSVIPEVHQQVTSLLRHPLPRRVSCDPGQVHAAGAVLDVSFDLAHGKALTRLALALTADEAAQDHLGNDMLGFNVQRRGIRCTAA